MELAFIVSALRRYFWLVILFAVLGTIPGLLTFRGGEDLYESRAVLVITPPVQAGAVASGVGDSDRYIAGEISVMQSLSDTVADQVDGVSAAQLDQWVSFAQQPLTNVVVVVAKAPTPELAQQIAQAYSDAYFEVLSVQLASSIEPTLEAVESEIAVVQENLRNVDQQLADALAPFIARGVAASAEQVAPSLASDRELLVIRFNELSSRRAELSTGLRISSRVIREPTLPEFPLSSSNRLLVIAGGMAGAFGGVVLALVAARFSRRVIDDEQVVELLGHPVAGTMPPRPELARGRRALLEQVDPAAARFLDSLGVRVEAASEHATTTVLVTGVTVGSGCTTVAASLARQLALTGAHVLLVDADPRRSELNELLSTAETLRHGAIETPLDTLRVCDLAGLGQVVDTRTTPSTRRRDLGEVMEAIHRGVEVDVVVFDGGPLMDAASTVTLSRLCDVVVLAMPSAVQVRALQTVASELSERDHLLPIWVSTVTAESDGDDDQPVGPAEEQLPEQKSPFEAAAGRSTWRQPPPLGQSDSGAAQATGASTSG